VANFEAIVLGFILTLVGGIFWAIFSVIGALDEIATHEKPTLMLGLVNLFSLLLFFSLPVTVVIELENWVKRRKAGQLEVAAIL